MTDLDTDPVEAAHAPYLAHIMSAARCCHAPSARYCEIGKALRVDYLAAFIMSQPDRLERRRIMQAERRDAPHLFPALKQRVHEILGLNAAEE